jgi:16S rRNA (uracil1498-N3)-methyltransferase
MATIPRLFVPAALAPGASMQATAAQAHYLGTVLRANANDHVHLFNGQDGEWTARIADLRRDRLTMTVETQRRPQEPEPDLWLVFALLKRDATDLVVQKATELGASALLPVFTERTNAARVNETRLAAIATEAAEQCERLTVPVLHPPTRLPELLATWPADRKLYAAIERAKAASLPHFAAPTPHSAAPPPHSAAPKAALLVGPEGGFAPAELDAMLRHSFVTPVSLGPRILRAETACVAGLALLQAPRCG